MKRKVSDGHARRNICAQSIERLESDLSQLEVALEDIDRNEAKRQKNLQDERIKLSRFEQELEKCRAINEIETEHKQIDRELTSIRQSSHANDRTMRELMSRIQDATHQKHQVEEQFRLLAAKPVITPRMKLSRRLGPAARESMEREEMKINELQRNGKLLAKVHGPLLASLQVDDHHCASYVENIIPSRMATAWIVSTQEDWRALREQKIRTVILAPPLSRRNRPYNLEPVRTCALTQRIARRLQRETTSI